MPGQPKLFQGDIVVVKYPFTDHENSKARPAIVVSNSTVNTSNDVIIAPITTTIRNDAFSFHVDGSMLTKAIAIQGEVRCNNLATFAKSKAKKISSLKPEHVAHLANKIAQSFL